jgi:hypothetical protein
MPKMWHRIDNFSKVFIIFCLVVAKEMPIRLVLEKRIPSANNNLKEDSK